MTAALQNGTGIALLIHHRIRKYTTWNAGK